MFDYFISKSIADSMFFYYNINNYTYFTTHLIKGGLSLFDHDYKIIAICSADIEQNSNDQFYKAMTSFSARYNFKLLFFNAFSSLYNADSNGKHELGESSIFHLINYELLDGIIMLSNTIQSNSIRNDIVDNAVNHNIPIVSIDYPIDRCININFKFEPAFEHLINHLIEDHGYRRINFIAGQRYNNDSIERLEIYRKVLTEHNIPIEEERIGYGDFYAEPTFKVLDTMMESDLPFPEAIVCANDSMAIAAYNHLTESGYNIPKDVAITGFDGLIEAIGHIPPIPTIQHDYEGAVIKAYDILSAVFNGEEYQKEYWIKSVFISGSTCGCPVRENVHSKVLSHVMYDRYDELVHFCKTQISMTADLTDSDSFQGVFEKLMQYSQNFGSRRFWLCIVDNFLSEDEELLDIIESSSFKRNGYSNHMDVMLSQRNNIWEGITDFETASLLPNFERILKEEDNLMFLPLHFLNQTIGYVALVYDINTVKMDHLYQFLMNISNALETTKTHLIQQNIISTLENKYVHDPMTGLLNRRGFYQKVTPLYQKCLEEGIKLLVVSADLNGLKHINDTYGHADGDIAISTVGRALNFSTPSSGACARFGGDEFVMAGIFDNDYDIDKVRSTFQKYLDDFNAVSDKPYTVSSSFGIVTGIPSKDFSLEQFIKVADEEMYKEKVKHHQNRIN